MTNILSAAIAVIALSASPAFAEKPVPKPIPSPSEIVAASPASDWTVIAPSDLLIMELAPGAKGKSRTVVIQLMPAPTSQGWIGNIRKLAAANWWDGTAIVRVQDNYVTQWGDPDGEDPKKAKPLPEGLVTVPGSEYVTAPPWPKHWLRSGYVIAEGGVSSGRIKLSKNIRTGWVAEKVERWNDQYADTIGWIDGWPMGNDAPLPKGQRGKGLWPTHCYGMVGVGRNYSPDTGTGAELYTVIGHAPRHLDRNIALVGRIIEGMEHMSSLPRGTGALGFYETPEERTKILSVRLMSQMGNDKPLPEYEYLNTESASFAQYADARANRRDPFFITPAGGADICNIPVPVRRKKV